MSCSPTSSLSVAKRDAGTPQRLVGRALARPTTGHAHRHQAVFACRAALPAAAALVRDAWCQVVTPCPRRRRSRCLTAVGVLVTAPVASQVMPCRSGRRCCRAGALAAISSSQASSGGGVGGDAGVAAWPRRWRTRSHRRRRRTGWGCRRRRS